MAKSETTGQWWDQTNRERGAMKKKNHKKKSSIANLHIAKDVRYEERKDRGGGESECMKVGQGMFHSSIQFNSVFSIELN